MRCSMLVRGLMARCAADARGRDRARGRRDAAALRLTLAAAIVCAGWTTAAADEALSAARERWSAAGLTAYEYGYRKSCECYNEEPPETLVTVRAGRVLDVRQRHAGSDADVRGPHRNLDVYWTVDGLFELIESALARNGTVRAAYHATLGYPTDIYIDYDADSIGDELELALTRVSALPR